MRSLQENWLWFTKCFDNSQAFSDMSMLRLSDRATSCGEDLAALEKWIDYRQNRTLCIEIGLGSFVSVEVCEQFSDIERRYESSDFVSRHGVVVLYVLGP